MPFQVKCHNCGVTLYIEERPNFAFWGMNSSLPSITNWLQKNVPKQCPHCGCKRATVPLSVEVETKK